MSAVEPDNEIDLAPSYPENARLSGDPHGCHCVIFGQPIDTKWWHLIGGIREPCFVPASGFANLFPGHLTYFPECGKQVFYVFLPSTRTFGTAIKVSKGKHSTFLICGLPFKRRLDMFPRPLGKALKLFARCHCSSERLAKYSRIEE